MSTIASVEALHEFITTHSLGHAHVELHRLVNEIDREIRRDFMQLPKDPYGAAWHIGDVADTEPTPSVVIAVGQDAQQYDAIYVLQGSQICPVPADAVTHRDTRSALKKLLDLHKTIDTDDDGAEQKLIDMFADKLALND